MMPKPPCHCEHIRHFPHDELDRYPVAEYPRDGHRYMRVPAGEQRAEFVGEVCDTCAETCVSQYLMP